MFNKESHYWYSHKRYNECLNRYSTLNLNFFTKSYEPHFNFVDLGNGKCVMYNSDCEIKDCPGIYIGNFNTCTYSISHNIFYKLLNEKLITYENGLWNVNTNDIKKELNMIFINKIKDIGRDKDYLYENDDKKLNFFDLYSSNSINEDLNFKQNVESQKIPYGDESQKSIIVTKKYYFLE